MARAAGSGSAAPLTVVKLRPDGTPAARYQAVPFPAPTGWVAARATWVYGRVDIGLLTFEPGDLLDEYFSLDRPYNAFAIFRGGETFAGWYCNVTHPTALVGGELHWHDLYVDIVVTPDGVVHVLDEDELADSGLAATDPALHATILAARDELLSMIETRAYPFSEALFP